MNFGVKIVILYLSFVALILTLVFMSYNQDVELVSSDYYMQELNFQKKINAIKNEQALYRSINHVLTDNQIVLTVDSGLLSNDFEGTIKLYCPSDSKKDVEFKMHFKDTVQVINTNKLPRGTYKLQLSWTSNQKKYFKEEGIFIN